MTDNNDNDNKLTSAYLEYNMLALSNLINSVKSAMDSFVTIQLPIDAIENLYSTLLQFKPLFNNMVNLLDNSRIIHTSELLLESFKKLSLPSYNFTSLVENVSIESDSVILNDEAIGTLTQLFTDNQEPTDDIASQMSIKEFLLVVLLPLLCMIIPMLQNSYYHKLDAIEAQKNQIMEAEYQKAILELESQHTMELEELNNNINDLLQYLESVQDCDSTDADAYSPVPDEVLMSSYSLPSEAETDDVFDNSHENKSEE